MVAVPPPVFWLQHLIDTCLAELRNQLRGGGRRPFTSDGSVETKPGQIRRPDVGVDCGRRDPNATKATSPRVVVEVLSPTTRDFDTIGKLDEYKLIDSLAHIVVIEPNAPEVIVWARGDDRSWRKAIRQGLIQEIDMPEIGVTLALAEIYDGVEFPARPRLVAKTGRTERLGTGSQAGIPARTIRIRHIMEYFLCSRTETFGSIATARNICFPL